MFAPDKEYLYTSYTYCLQNRNDAAVKPSLRHSVTRHIKTPPHYQENLHTKYITIIYNYLYIIVKI